MRTPVALCLVVLAGCGGGASSGPVSNQAPKANQAISADPLALIPADADVVAHLDVQKLRASATWQKFEPKLIEMAGPTLGQLRTQCGVDPLTTMHSVSFGLKNLQQPSTSAVLVVRGLERDKWMACADQHRAASNGEMTIERGVVTLNSRDAHGVATFADSTTLVAILGLAPVTRADLDKLLGSGVPLKTSPAFSELLGNLRVTDPLWFLINGNARMLEGAQSAIGVKPKAVYGSIDLASGLASQIRARLATPDEAKRFADMANNQLSNGQASMLKGMVERLEASSDKADVVLEVRVNQTQLESLVQMAGMFSP